MSSARVPWLHVIAGCMSSGKTAEVVRLLTRAEIAGRKVLLLTPKPGQGMTLITETTTGADGRFADNLKQAIIDIRKRPLIPLDANGAGQVAKACNQIVGALNNLAMCEALLFAAKMGVDPRKMLEAVDAGAGIEWATLRADGSEFVSPALTRWLGATDWSGIRALLETNDVRRRTHTVMLVFSIAYNLLAVGLAVAGRMSPMLAAILMPVNSLLTLAIVSWGMRRVFRRADA